MWWIIGITAVFVAMFIFIGISLYHAPLMPEDYGLKEEDIWPGNEITKKEDPKLKVKEIKKNKKRSFNKSQPESLLKYLPPNDYELDN
jgi:hypothetical protein|tara:strand:+ start:695 stop:958 length:264 start_codon:yes stop_codon:yes gene_type:complete